LWFYFQNLLIRQRHRHSSNVIIIEIHIFIKTGKISVTEKNNTSLNLNSHLTSRRETFFVVIYLKFDLYILIEFCMYPNQAFFREINIKYEILKFNMRQVENWIIYSTNEKKSFFCVAVLSLLEGNARIFIKWYHNLNISSLLFLVGWNIAGGFFSYFYHIHSHLVWYIYIIFFSTQFDLLEGISCLFIFDEYDVCRS
jgi:hypothetical protein